MSMVSSSLGEGLKQWKIEEHRGEKHMTNKQVTITKEEKNTLYMDGLVSKDINELFVKATTRTYLNKFIERNFNNNREEFYNWMKENHLIERSVNITGEYKEDINFDYCLDEGEDIDDLDFTEIVRQEVSNNSYGDFDPYEDNLEVETKVLMQYGECDIIEDLKEAV